MRCRRLSDRRATWSRIDPGLSSARTNGAGNRCSSEIGAATVRKLAEAGFETVAVARRVERCRTLAKEVGGQWQRLDVTDPKSVEGLRDRLPRVDVIVHSVGGAIGLDSIAEARDEDWRLMWEKNVLGVTRVTRRYCQR